MTCFGKDFTDNCINGTNDKPINLVIGEKHSFQFTLVGEMQLCPNERNNITIEDLSCFLNTTKYMDVYHYMCVIPDGNSKTVHIETQKHVMLCQLKEVNMNCGSNISQALCELFDSPMMKYYFQWPALQYSCDSYMDDKCICVHKKEGISLCNVNIIKEDYLDG